MLHHENNNDLNHPSSQQRLQPSGNECIFFFSSYYCKHDYVTGRLNRSIAKIQLARILLSRQHNKRGGEWRKEVKGERRKRNTTVLYLFYVNWIIGRYRTLKSRHNISQKGVLCICVATALPFQPIYSLHWKFYRLSISLALYCTQHSTPFYFNHPRATQWFKWTN